MAYRFWILKYVGSIERKPRTHQHNHDTTSHHLLLSFSLALLTCAPVSYTHLTLPTIYSV